MTKPTKAAILQQREDVIRALTLLRQALPNDEAVQRAFVELETFCAVACRVFAKTNLSKLQSETRTVELAARLAGRVVFDPGN